MVNKWLERAEADVPRPLEGQVYALRMEGYVKMLNPVAKSRYLEKLSLLGLCESDGHNYIERKICRAA